ncbi:MAG: tRNA-dihydrouridine synthase [Candidatus Pacebacteria bacterium]|nr:tRNA-dihydrouridine synthase [Candidatus Paceibacterota bacterium]
MADVTDPAFRRIIAKYGKPDVLWTEFVSADGMFLGGKKAHDLLIRDLAYIEEERPIIAQMFTSDPGRMKKAAELCRKLGFDGFDINMGCPDRSIEKQVAGSALIKHPELAKELVLAAKEGAGDMPVSVKTRIGYNENQIEEWLPNLLRVEPAVVTLHARTRKEMSKVPARWDVIKRAVEIRDSLGSKTLIFGNGDVKSLNEIYKRIEETGCDGVMVGRGIFGNPWFFNENVKKEDISPKEILEVLLEHTKLYVELLGDTKSFAVMKKHFKAYVSDFDGAKELRTELMECSDYSGVEKVINNYISRL